MKNCKKVAWKIRKIVKKSLGKYEKIQKSRLKNMKNIVTIFICLKEKLKINYISGN